MSDPWDPERRRPSPENDAEWPEGDLWQSWDRPAEPEPAADSAQPWADAEGDELWSDSVGSRPISTTPWTGPTWDDQPWAEPPPGERRPDLSAFVGPAEVAEPREGEPRKPQPAELPGLPEEEPPEPPEPPEQEPSALGEPEPPAEVERLEPPAEDERREAQPSEPEPTLSLLERAGLVDPEPREPALEPTSSPLQPVGRVESREEPAEEPADEAADEPAADERARTAPKPVPEPGWREAEPVAEAEWRTREPVAEDGWAVPEPAAEAAWTVPERVAERIDEPPWAGPEALPDPPEPTEQAFAAFAPEREPEAAQEPAPQAAELEPQPEDQSRPYEPFEVIEGGALTGSLDASAGEIETTLGAEHDWDGRSERRQPTTAEQVVPWLIGVILLLIGMVIVLMALIFTSDNGVLAGLASPSAGAIGSIDAVPSADPAATPSRTPTTSPAPTPKPSTTAKPAVPTFGPLEMVYLGRSAALAHIYLLQHDFTVDVAPVVLAQDPAQDVERLSWSSDGSHGAAIIAGRLVTIEAGKPKRALADGIVASTFSPDGRIVYALRIVLGNGTDRAEVLQITYASGATKRLTQWTYPRPVIGAESAVKEAQFADEGGSQRLYRMADGTLRIWMLGAPTYGVTATGRTTRLAAATLPALWSGDGMKRIDLTQSGETTIMTLRNPAGAELAKRTVAGLVSHLRWSRDDSQVAFTLGRSVGGGVQQDLFLWDLSKDKAPMQLTNTGAAFGAEWLGAAESWRP